MPVLQAGPVASGRRRAADAAVAGRRRVGGHHAGLLPSCLSRRRVAVRWRPSGPLWAGPPVPASGKKDNLRLYLANMGLHHPHQVVTLALDGCVLLDVAIPVHVFGYHGGGRYRFTLAGHHRGPVRTSTGVVLHAEAGLRALTTADTVIVPGYEAVLRPPPPSVLASLRAAAARGARLLSICTGAFALAHAGLLDGRRATTHWAAAAQLADRFPGVTVDAGVLYVDDDTILTSAGVAAGLDLCLPVVRRDHGAAVAASIARHTVVAPHRDGDQAQFIQQPIPATQPGGTSLLTTRSWALEHLHERLDLARLARHAGVSPRTFARRFHAETGTTPLQWVLGQRVLLARQLLEQTDLPIETLAHACGFSTAPLLRRHFTRATGTTPTAYRRAFTLHQLTTPTTLTAPTGAVAWSPNAPQEEARLGRLPGRGASEAGRRIDPMNALSQWSDLELRHLLALQAIAEYGSFHKAAEHLGYTQSGISQQIAALERIIGERLLERPGGSRPVRLTDAGDVVLRHACAIFDQITAAQADVAALDEISVGVLRVGAFQSVSAKILPQLLRRLAGQRPRLRIELTQTTSDPELFGLLKAGQL